MAGTIVSTKNNLAERKAYNGAKKTVITQTPIQMYMIQYANAQGEIEEPTVVLEIGGKIWVPADAQSWAKGLKPAMPWVEEQVLAVAKAHAESLKKSPVDSVDILGADDAPTAG